MAARADLPAAVATLVDVAVGLARRAPSSRIAIARAGGILEPAAIDPAVRDAVEREVEAARRAACVELPFAEVERVLRGAWRRAPREVLDDLEREPLSVTPAAQVHRAEADGGAVAVKVRRPGVERAVRNDLALLEGVAAPLRAAFPRLDAIAVLRDIREQTLDELDFEHEASQQRRVARSLRDVPGITVPRPHLELSTPDVLVSDLAAGETLASGAAPADPAAAARALVAAFRTAVLDAGLAPLDPRASHVVVAPGGGIALLGMGVARPVDRERARRALAALAATADGDEDAFAAVVEDAGLLAADEAREAFGAVREVLGAMIDGPARLDAGALLDLGDRAAALMPMLARLAQASAPRPDDLALGRMLGQLVALLARLGATEDWVALAR